MPSSLSPVFVFPRLSRLARAAITLGLMLSAGAAEARIETLRWTHPEPNSVAAFAIYTRSPNGSFADASYFGLPKRVGGVYSADISIPGEDEMVVAVSAWSPTLLESEYSNEGVRAALPPAGDWIGSSVLDGSSVVGAASAFGPVRALSLSLFVSEDVWVATDGGSLAIGGGYETDPKTGGLKLRFNLSSLYVAASHIAGDVSALVGSDVDLYPSFAGVLDLIPVGGENASLGGQLRFFYIRPDGRHQEVSYWISFAGPEPG